MLEEELELNKAIAEFVKPPEISYTDFTARVIKNLSVLNLKLLNKLGEGMLFHLLNALCLTTRIALDMKQWEYMLGRKDGAWYWNNHGLFFSSLHSLIPSLNALHKHVSEIEQGFTGGIICLGGAV
jgi:hypothetical protein